VARATGQGEGRWLLPLLLTLVGAVVLVGLSVALYRPWGEGTSEGRVVPQNLPAALAEGVTAKGVYAAAMEEARSWQPDGQLAIVSAHWRTRDRQWLANVSWMFQFYSPSTRRLAVIVVDKGRARLLSESPTPYSLPTIDQEQWQIDSLAALNTWWNLGGGTFVSLNPDLDLTAQLRPVQDAQGGDRLVWSVVGVMGSQVKRLTIDGTTGEPVQG
jgi:hypothetical protein